MLTNLIKHAIFVSLFCFYMISAAFPEPAFNPWEADVSIADENEKSDEKSVHNDVNVYSAPQGGAFFLIRFFQLVISPQDGPNCRFKPTCSNYGKSAVLRYGSLLGSILAGERLLRCNPYSPPGKDPVPQRIFE